MEALSRARERIGSRGRWGVRLTSHRPLAAFAVMVLVATAVVVVPSVTGLEEKAPISHPMTQSSIHKAPSRWGRLFALWGKTSTTLTPYAFGSSTPAESHSRN